MSEAVAPAVKMPAERVRREMAFMRSSHRKPSYLKHLDHNDSSIWRHDTDAIPQIADIVGGSAGLVKETTPNVSFWDVSSALACPP